MVWFFSPLLSAGFTSFLFIGKENDKIDPDGYIERTKSIVSPYFAFCSIATMVLITSEILGKTLR